MTFPLLDGAAFAQLTAESRQQLLTTLATRLVELGYATPSFPAAIVEREATYPTGLPTVIPASIPHTAPQHVRTSGFAIATLKHPVEFREMGSASGTVQVRLVVMMLLASAHEQLEGLQLLMARLQDEAAVQQLLEHTTDEGLLASARDWLTA